MSWFWPTGATRARVAVACLVVGVVLLAWCFPDLEARASKGSRKSRRAGNVQYVQDGDTLRLRTGRSSKVVRLAGIDAPEHDQPWGQEARKFLAGLVKDQEVRVESPTGARSRGAGRRGSLEVEEAPSDEVLDRYGRTLGHLYLPDGRSVEAEMVAAGMAWRFRAFSRDPVLGELEEQARRAKRGLWSLKDPIAPWRWRERAESR